VTVEPTQGSAEVPYAFKMPNWTEMREGIAIPAIARGHQMTDPDSGAKGGFQPARNTTFKKYLTRTMRPVVDFDKCIKCTLCWIACPDSVFDVTPDGFYDANMAACCGCGVCEQICPVEKCISMINETSFENNDSQWEAWRKDKPAYSSWLVKTIADRPERSHGFRYRGQYEEQVPGALKIAQES
jgi:pyruvate ferredoxin oxidoreductase delta subunit